MFKEMLSNSYLFGANAPFIEQLYEAFLQDPAAVDPHWRDYILFYEYFHGDNGAGLGASHQTGWTGIVARLMDLFGRMDANEMLTTGKEQLGERLVREQVGGRA